LYKNYRITKIGYQLTTSF